MSENVAQFPPRAIVDAMQSSGGGGMIPPMDGRVAKLEDFAQETRERLVRIETRLDQTATKADLSDAMNGMVKWVVGTAVGLGVAGITVMTFVLNNAVPKSPAPNPTPIVIQLDGVSAAGALGGATLSVVPSQQPKSPSAPASK